MKSVIAALTKVSDYINEFKENVLGPASKFLVAAVPTFGLVVGTDAPVYAKVVSILISLGVYAVPNPAK